MKSTTIIKSCHLKSNSNSPKAPKRGARRLHRETLNDTASIQKSSSKLSVEDIQKPTSQESLTKDTSTLNTTRDSSIDSKADINSIHSDTLTPEEVSQLVQEVLPDMETLDRLLCVKDKLNETIDGDEDTDNKEDLDKSIERDLSSETLKILDNLDTKDLSEKITNQEPVPIDTEHEDPESPKSAKEDPLLSILKETALVPPKKSNQISEQDKEMQNEYLFGLHTSNELVFGAKGGCCSLLPSTG